MYKITKLVHGKYRGATDTPIVNKQGRLLTTKAEQEARWEEHFSEALNRSSPTIEKDEQDPDTDLEHTTRERKKILAAIRSLKSGITPGQVSLNAKLSKADPEFAVKVLRPLFAVIWEQKQLPDDWTEGAIKKIPKIGAQLGTDRADDAECSKALAGQSQRRRSSNNRRIYLHG